HQLIEPRIDLPGAGDAVQFAAVGGLPQGAYHVAAEVFGQGSDREQVVAFGRMPVARFGQSAAGDEAVQMHVPAQGLAPGVQYTGHAKRAVQALWVSTEGIEGIPDALEQQRVDDLGMELYPLVELMGQGEHPVIIRHRQERLLLVFTLPHELNEWVELHPEVIYPLLSS